MSDGLNIKIDLDTSKATAEIKQLENLWKNATNAVTKQKLEVERLTSEIKKLQSQMKASLDGVSDPKKISEITKTYGEAMSGLNKDLEIAKKNLEQAAQKADFLGQKLKSASQQQQPSMFSNIGKTFENVGKSLESLRSKSIKTFSSIGNFANNAFSMVGNVIKKPFEGIGNIISDISGKIAGLGQRILQLASFTFVFSLIRSGLRFLRDGFFDLINANSTLQASLARVKGNLLTAFQPIWEVILPYLIRFAQWLEKVTAAIAAFMSALFGKSVQVSRANAQQLQTQVQASKDTSKALGKQKSQTDKLEKSTKKLNMGLAKFDELNVLSGQKGGKASKTPSAGGGRAGGIGGGGAGGIGGIDFSTPNYDTSAIEAFANKFKEAFKPIGEALQRLFPQLERLGSFSLKAFYDFYESFLKPLGEYAINYAIPEFLNITADALEKMNFDGLNEGLKELFAALVPITEGLIEGALTFYREFLAPLAVYIVNTALIRFIQMITEALKGLDISGLVESLKELLQALEPFTEKLIEGLLDFIEFFLIPLATYVVNNALPHFLKSISDTLKKIDMDKVIKGLKGLYKQLEKFTENVIQGVLWFVDKFLLPIAAWVVNTALVQFLRTITNILNALNTALDILKPLLDYVYNQLIVPLGEFLDNLFVDIMNDVNQVFEDFNDVLGDNKEDLEKIGRVITDVLSVAFVLLSSQVRNSFNLIRDVIKIFLKNVMNIADSVIKSMSGIIDFIQGAFEGDWKKAFKGLGNFVIGTINSVISAINAGLNLVKALINNILDGVNTVIKGINLIPNVNIPLIPRLDTSKDAIGKIPYLAQGAVIPPNNPYLAWVGDQRQGTNVEAPLETIKEALVEALSEANEGVIGNYTFVAQLDGNTLFEEIINRNNMYMNQAGRSAFA